MRVYKPLKFETRTELILEASGEPLNMSFPLATCVLYSTSTSLTFETTPSLTDTTDNASIPSRYLKYRMTQKNFAKMVKTQKKFERQLNIWAKEFKLFVNRVVIEALKPYKNLHARMDDMEEHMTDKLR